MPEFAPGDVAVVIPTRERWGILKQTLEALAAQTIAGFETIVIADGTDQSPPPLENVRLLVKEHGGPGAARNVGVRSTDRPLVLFLGDDMIPAPDLVSSHLAKHNERPEPETAVLGFVDLHREIRSNRLNTWMDWSGTQFDYRHITSEEAGWGRFYSCNVSLKRDFFLDAGGFDEDFVYYYEDLDCGWRLHQKGLTLLFEPNAVAHHLHPLVWSDVLRRFQGIARGERLMAAKHAWFEPFFAKSIRNALGKRRASRLWTLLVERIPSRSRFRRAAESKANTWYQQAIGPYFLDAWEGSRDLEELREYLGDRFDEDRLVHHTHEVRRELASIIDEATFYRTSEAYLYDLTAFAMSGTKVPYHLDLERVVGPKARLIDWGCGIGSDGLRLIENGHAVSFADFDNPSTTFLRWRLERRRISTAVYDIDTDDIPADFDCAYAFDVIEHVEEPFQFLAELERRARIVMVNLLEDEPHSEHPHRSLPIRAILDHAKRRGLLLHRRYHGRSHLIAYRGTDSTRQPRLRSAIRRSLDTLRPHDGRPGTPAYRS